MKIRIVAAGRKMPDWVYSCCDDYSKRLRGEVRISWHEVPLARRSSKQSVQSLRAQETAQLLQQVQDGDHVVALCERGSTLDTRQFSEAFAGWRALGKPLCILIGGPDGIDFDLRCDRRNSWPDERISLSALTFPHPMVRVILAEQLYRAWSIGAGHPYHRD